MTYTASKPVIGSMDVTNVVTAGALGDPTGITQLPSVTLEAKLGEVCEAWDATLGAAKFILLRVPTSTAITVGLLYQYDKNYQVTVVPAGSSSKNTGAPVVLAYTAVSSNASSVQYAWFLIQGQAPALKTAVTCAPQQALFMSATAGRVYFTSSAGKGIIGGRTANTATVTSTTSTVNITLQFSALESA